jgi:hypothetical protein
VEEALDPARPRLRDVSGTFPEALLGKVQRDLPSANLKVHRLAITVEGDHFLDELGDGAETRLAQVWHLFLRQPQGGDGALCSEKQDVPLIKNAFFIRGADGELRAITLHWEEGRLAGWVVDAVPTSKGFDSG